MSNQACISNIKRFALDDGPGIRTTVFFKGCPLNCVWCHNPETISPEPEIVFSPESCIRCETCKKVCEAKAINLAEPEIVNHKVCTLCGACVEHCPTVSLETIGKYYTIDHLITELLRDKVFYETSGGGITLSGGEPTFYLEYLSKVAAILKQNKIHIALQTCGMFDLDKFRLTLLPFIDVVYFDLKIINNEKHKQYTKQDNTKILKNFNELCKMAPEKMIATSPLIPNITTPTENMQAIALVLKQAKCSAYELRPYNPVSLAKRKKMHKPIDPQLLPGRFHKSKENDVRNMFVQLVGK